MDFNTEKIMSERITATEQLKEWLSVHLSFEQQMQFEGLFQQSKEIEEENIKRAFWDGSQCEHDYIGIEEIYFNDKYSEHIEVNKSENINDNLPFD
jgi:hypothetical protein